MITTVKETCMKEMDIAGDLERETELLQKEMATADITNQTPFLSIFCC